MRPALGESARLYHQTPGEESHKQSDKNIGRVTSLAEDA
jgi:hypothetical protein